MNIQQRGNLLVQKIMLKLLTERNTNSKTSQRFRTDSFFINLYNQKFQTLDELVLYFENELFGKFESFKSRNLHPNNPTHDEIIYREIKQIFLLERLHHKFWNKIVDNIIKLYEDYYLSSLFIQ